jgi:nucleoside phosphorylase
MKFESYFGTKPDTISKNCILCPTSGDGELFGALGAKTEHKGFFSKVINYPQVSVICTKNNLLIGDCVMLLKDTPCENIFLFGSCGGTGSAQIGDIVVLKKTFNYESFSEMLEMKRTPDSYYPSHALLNKFTASLNASDSTLVKQVYGAATSSLVLEKKYIDWFEKNRVLAIDMESSTVFAAANYINRKAVCLMYVADHVSYLEPDEALNDEYKKQIVISRRRLADMIINYIKNA